MTRPDKCEKRYARGQFLRPSISKFILLFIVILTFVHISDAVPEIPMIVSGSVHINGIPAPAGTAITAMSGGELKGSTILTQSGTYGMMVNYTQGSVEFYVNNTKVQSINWSSDPQVLNLSVMISRMFSSPKATYSMVPEVRATDTVIPKIKDPTQGMNTPQEEILRRTM